MRFPVIVFLALVGGTLEAQFSSSMSNSPGIDLSASDIRRRIAEGRSVRYLVPRAVEMYLHENRMYRS